MGKKKLKNGNDGTKEDLEIDNDFSQYIREIAQQVMYSELDDENRIALINNFEIPENKESILAQHTLGSQVLDKLIGFATPDNFEKYTLCLKDLRKLILNTNSSFVLESCIKIATIRALADENVVKKEDDNEPESKKKKFSKKSTDVDYNLEQDFKPVHIEYCNNFVLRLCKFALNNMEDLLTTQGSHFIRTCVLCLSGIVSYKQHDKSSVNQINLKTDYGKSLSPEWTEIINDFASRLQLWPHFSQLALHEKPSTFLQVLCQALHNSDQKKALKKFVKSIMKKCFDYDDEEENQKPFRNKSSTFLLEAMLKYCEEKQFLKLYEKYFKGKLPEMAGNEFNFTVQRLFDFVKSKEIFEEMFNAIAVNFSTLLQNGKTGVILSISKACERLSFKQGQFIQNLVKALECEKAQTHVIPCIATLLPASAIEASLNNIEVHLHGSLILQNIMNFNKPIKIVQSILDMKPQVLSDIFCHQKGSRIADTFLESKFIGEKSREKLIKHLEGMYLKMALSKNGSHVLEKLYQSALEPQKEMIVSELAERLSQLNGSGCGKIISYKLNVETYAKNANQWRNYMARSSK